MGKGGEPSVAKMKSFFFQNRTMFLIKLRKNIHKIPYRNSRREPLFIRIESRKPSARIVSWEKFFLIKKNNIFQFSLCGTFCVLHFFLISVTDFVGSVEEINDVLSSLEDKCCFI